jgi:hypothetical protein
VPSGILLTGRRFGHLLVGRELRCDIYKCVCECGSKLTVWRSSLTKGVIRSCRACSTRKRSKYFAHVRFFIGRDGKRHQRSSSEYLSWCACRERCFVKTNAAYPNYGGRGITVDPAWLPPKGVGFKAFLKAMGPRPVGKTLDRIDVQGHYEPGNCRWADDDTQAQNRRCILFPDGVEPPVADVPFDLDAELACG